MTHENGLQRRKSRSVSGSARMLRDEDVTRPYSARVRNLDQTPPADPVTAWDRLFQKYAANTDTGRRLRQSVAKTWLHDMAAVETEVQEREAEQGAIVDHIARMQAEHELNMQYLVHFGVTVSERETFRSLLEEVIRDGNLTIREVANRAHDVGQRNGDAPAEGGEESLSVAV